jgi:hypothetical protein
VGENEIAAGHVIRDSFRAGGDGGLGGRLRTCRHPEVRRARRPLHAYLVDHHLRLLTYGVLVEAGAALLVGFFAGLAYLHREVDRSVVPLAITGASAGVMTRVVIIAGAALTQLAVVSAHRGGDAEMVKTLFQGLGVLFAPP